MLAGHFAEATKLQPLALVAVPFVAVLVAIELGAFALTGRFGFWSEKTEKRKAPCASRGS